jgi:asparagine synthase (glutamine-hydrolysing)
MCGIAGWFNRGGRTVDAKALAAMSAALIHRGPDGDGLWSEGAIGLAHRRLAIRDLSPNGRQPMADPTGRIVVTYNGEIYNDRELRGNLERNFGFEFRTSCDTEILPYAYLAWGEAMFERLDGFYALGLWDRDERRLLLARDGIGIKPLYYAASGDAVLFASEVKGLLASGRVTSELDPDALHTFFAAGHAGTTRSLIEGVQQVPPGSVVSFTATKRVERQFWRPYRAPKITDLETALGRLERALDEVVESQLVSDVPVAVLQSGGIDSSLISLTLGRRGLKTQLFTASFADRSHDETNYARLVAAAAGLPLRTIECDTSHDLEAAFRAVVYHFDGQCADTGALAFYQLAGSVREYSTVVLSGDGGDEFFCGYETYSATRAAEVARRVVPPWFARLVGRLAYRANTRNEGRLPLAAMAARFALGLGEGGATPHLYWRRLVPGFIAQKLYGPAMEGLAAASPYTEYAQYYCEPHSEVLDRAMIADQRFHLQSVLTKVDAMSMAHSLEVRVPLLDRRIMELAGQIDVSLMNPPPKGPPKYLLRKLAERLGMPASVASARKRGFNVPIARLMRRDLMSICDQVLDRHADVLAPYLKPEAVRRLWRDHRDEEAENAFALWPILIVATWKAGFARPQKQHLPEPYPPISLAV